MQFVCAAAVVDDVVVVVKDRRVYAVAAAAGRATVVVYEPVQVLNRSPVRRQTPSVTVHTHTRIALYHLPHIPFWDATTAKLTVKSSSFF
jgi:hypothetical protein